MLQNAYFLAKIGADTAENEQHFAEICLAAMAYDPGRSLRPLVPELARFDGALRCRGIALTAFVCSRLRRHAASIAISANFGKMLLVFGCIGTDLCKKIRVFQHFSKSTRLSS